MSLTGPSTYIGNISQPRAFTACAKVASRESFGLEMLSNARKFPPALTLKSSIAGIELQVQSSFKHVRSVSTAIYCGQVQKVSAADLNDVLLNDRSLPIVVDFYATWCGPCVLLAQELEQLALEYHGQVKFLKVDTDEEYELASQLQIRGLPTLVFISPDKTKLASRVEGLLPRDTIREMIEEL